ALKPGRDPEVIAWLDLQSAETLFITATSLSELLIGVAIMPAGKRKTVIKTALDSLISRLFDLRILPFDHDAAIAYSTLMGRARAAGNSVSMADGQIAAVASIHGFSVATRDLAPFRALGVPVIDPWRHSAR
ncbi:MAG TPA: type II toxin-antitoxin system VapC family toxin, partial [Chroococcales cyanobacterium]